MEHQDEDTELGIYEHYLIVIYRSFDFDFRNCMRSITKLGSLAASGNEAALDLLIQALEVLRNDPYGTLRQTIVSTLGESAQIPAFRGLQIALNDSDPFVRRDALKRATYMATSTAGDILGQTQRIAQNETLKLLEMAEKDQHELVRNAISVYRSELKRFIYEHGQMEERITDFPDGSKQIQIVDRFGKPYRSSLKPPPAEAAHSEGYT